MNASGGLLLPEPAKELQQRLGTPVLPDPQQTLPRGINLIDEGQEVAAVLPVDLVDADRANAGEIHVITPPGDGHGDRPKHLVPAGTEDARDLFPTEALRPPREESHVGRGELVLAVRPGRLLDGHATTGTRDAPHHVEQEDARVS
jgi:hypothetical protein